MGKLAQNEIDDLRKSLTDLGLTEDEVDNMIEKAIREKEDVTEKQPGSETVKEMAGEEGTDKEKEEPKEEPEDEEIKKARMTDEYNTCKARMEEIEKSMPELKKSVDEDIQKSIDNDIQKSFDARFTDIEKSLGDRFESSLGDIQKSFDDTLTDIQKSYDSKIKALTEDLNKVANTPIPLKSVFNKANFFEKSLGGMDDEIGGEKQLSISRDKDELIKSLENELEKEKDQDIKTMLGQGISDLAISPTPNSHGQKALAYLSKKQNITLVS